MTFEKLLQQSLLWRGVYFITVLLVNVVLSRFLQAEGSGWIYYLTNFFSLILLVASLSMESGYTYYASGNIISHHKLAWFSLLWTGLIGIITAIGIGFYFSRVKNISAIETNHYLLYAITYVCGILLINFFTVLFYAAKDFFLPNLIMSAVNVLLILFIVYFSNKEEAYDTIVNSYFISILVQGVLLAMAFILQHRSTGEFSLPNTDAFKLLLKYSLVALAGNLLYYFMYKIDYWFVRYYCNQVELGNYIQASKLAQMVLIIPQILASVIFPQTAGGTKQNDVGKSILTLFRVMLQVFILLMLVTFLIGPSIFVVVFGKSFNNVQLPFLLLLPGIFSISVTVLLAAFFSGHGHVKLNVIGTGIGLLLVIVSDFLLVPTYGIIGAAIASTIGYSGFLIYALYHFSKLYSFNINEMLAFSKADWLWVKSIVVPQNKQS